MCRHPRLRSPRAGMTLIELLVLLTIIAILSSMVMAALGPVLRYAVATRCMSNLRQVGMAALAYASDWEQQLPAEGNLGILDPERSPAWFCRLPGYIDATAARTGIFQCAGFHGSPGVGFTNAMPKSFKFNSYLDDAGRPPHYCLESAPDGSEMVLFIDAVAKETGMGQWGHALTSAVDDSRHRGRVNILYCDGHGLGRATPPADKDWLHRVKWKSEGWSDAP